ncbi:DUF503 domain-containing protein [Guptibacillus sedimenti]|uniref:DUF503 domain-containing protein n=1 Tax=Guptibacillus sedimenti TaxID=3025680 RepID=UPI002361D45E|nr:DUF503 family protein [Pseudalkalibacillus sedimenti]
MIGYVECECIIYDAQSLKEKRAVLQSVISRLKHNNLAISELDSQDLWQHTVIGIVTTASSKTACERELQRAISLIDSRPDIEITRATYEWL